MLNLAYRNLRLFFRDKSAVFFSFLSVIIIIGLYVLFLGDMLVQNMEGVQGARFLMDSWIMAGLLAVASTTATMGAFGIMIEDRVNKRIKDIYAAPLSRSTIAGGYVLSTVLIGIIMSLVALVCAQSYVVAYGGELLDAGALLKTLGLIVLSVLASSAMVYFMVSFFSSNNAFSGASAIVGTLIGFLTGIYIPIGVLPEAVGFVIKIFPVSHAAVLFRQVLMAEPMAISFAGAPAAALADFKVSMGVVLTYGQTTADAWVHIAVLVATTIAFYALAIMNISRKRV